MLIELPRPRAANPAMADPASMATIMPMAPRVVRCVCERCGAHTNAVRTHRVGGSCPTCASFRLVPLEGAEPMDGPYLAP